MSKDLFERIKTELERIGLSSWVVPGDEDDPYDQMHVLTRVDELGRNFMLRLVSVSASTQGNSGAKMQALDLAMILPFKIRETAFDDTARLLAATNLGLLVGALGLVEADRVVMLRHVWHAPAPDFTAMRMIPLIEMMGYVAAEVAPMIEQVGSGRVRYDQLRQAVCEAVNAELPPRINESDVLRV